MRIAVLLLALLLPATASALELGEKAPDFRLTDQNGKTVQLKDFRGRWNVVVAFYPMAFTPG